MSRPHRPVSRETRRSLLDASLERLGIPIPEGGTDRLLAYEELLREEAIPRGLIASSDAGRILERHVLDSARSAAVPVPPGALVLDAGSGAGLPGIPFAILRPDVSVRLVDSRKGRLAFLELALEQLELSTATAVLSRIEDTTERADLVLARAFKPLPEAWRLVRPVLRDGGRLVFFAGAGSSPAAPRDAASVEVLRTPVLASSGALIIIAR